MSFLIVDDNSVMRRTIRHVIREFAGEINECADGAEAREAIAGLKPATAYHYRLVATNSSGTGYGDDVTFTTNSQVTDIVLLPDTGKFSTARWVWAP